MVSRVANPLLEPSLSDFRTLSALSFPPGCVASSSFKKQWCTWDAFWIPRNHEAVCWFFTDSTTLLVRKFIPEEIHFISRWNELILYHILSIFTAITLIQTLFTLPWTTRLQVVASSCNLPTVQSGRGRTVLNWVPWFIFWKHEFWP